MNPWAHLPVVCFLSACATCTERLVPPGCPKEYIQRQQAAQPLESGTCRRFHVDATQEWTGSGVDTAQGQRYRLHVLEVVTPWIDSWVQSTPEGGWGGIWKLGSPFATWKARAPSAPMYGLVCSFERSDESAWPLSEDSRREVAGRGGELSCFANDWPGRYSNNCGCALVEACREK